jgi:hypothetical protein
MTKLSSKWIILFYIVILTLAVLYLTGCKSVHSQITIKASPENVWFVLTDTEKIKEWNPVLIPVEGELKEGSTVKYEFHQDDENTSEIPAKVKQMVENKLLNQVGGMPGILTFDHQYILEAVDSGTSLIIHEDYRGIMVPFWNPAPVEKAYIRLAEALKERVESLTKKGLE